MLRRHRVFSLKFKKSSIPTSFKHVLRFSTYFSLLSISIISKLYSMVLKHWLMIFSPTRHWGLSTPKISLVNFTFQEMILLRPSVYSFPTTKLVKLHCFLQFYQLNDKIYYLDCSKYLKDKLFLLNCEWGISLPTITWEDNRVSIDWVLGQQNPKIKHNFANAGSHSRILKR